jgi:hypothetical protein
MDGAAYPVQPPYVSGVVPDVAVNQFLRSTVIPSAWPNAKLIESRVQRLRFSPGEECAAVATLTLDPAPTERPQVVVTFALAGSPSGFDGFYSSELGCFVEIFPSDWRLRDLREALAAEGMLQTITEVLAVDPAVAVQLDVSVLRYRPHSRAVLAYGLRDGSGATVGEAIGKVYRSASKARRAWQILDSIYRATGPARIIPKPLRLVQDATLVLMEKAAGRSLVAFLQDGSEPAATAAVAQVANALVAFHGAITENLKPHLLRKDMDSFLELMGNIGLAFEAEFALNELRSRIEKRFASLPPSRAATVHGAFKPSAVLIGELGVTIVDLDSCAAGDPARDVACFASKLRSMALDDDRARLSELADAFIETYAAAASDTGLRERVRTYEALYLACLALKHLQASWQGQLGALPARRLLELALELLD